MESNQDPTVLIVIAVASATLVVLYLAGKFYRWWVG